MPLSVKDEDYGSIARSAEKEQNDRDIASPSEYLHQLFGAENSSASRCGVRVKRRDEAASRMLVFGLNSK